MGRQTRLTYSIVESLSGPFHSFTVPPSGCGLVWRTGGFSVKWTVFHRGEDTSRGVRQDARCVEGVECGQKTRAKKHESSACLARNGTDRSRVANRFGRTVGVRRSSLLGRPGTPLLWLRKSGEEPVSRRE
jgi:hypothetical protein